MFKAYAVTFGSGTLAGLGLLTILFAILKMAHVVAWSWVTILCPLWLPMAIASACVIGVFCFLAIISACVFFLARKDESI